MMALASKALGSCGLEVGTEVIISLLLRCPWARHPTLSHACRGCETVGFV